jgi:hypothetical protein
MTDLSAIPATAIPADVRKAGGESTYKAALGFEGMLLDQLSGELMKDAGLADSPYGDTVTTAFSQSLLQGGGLGLAGQLYAAMKGSAT